MGKNAFTPRAPKADKGVWTPIRAIPLDSIKGAREAYLAMRKAFDEFTAAKAAFLATMHAYGTKRGNVPPAHLTVVAVRPNPNDDSVGIVPPKAGKEPETNPWE